MTEYKQPHAFFSFSFFFLEKEPHALLVMRIRQNTNRLIQITQNLTKIVIKILICGTSW